MNLGRELDLGGKTFMSFLSLMIIAILLILANGRPGSLKKKTVKS
jgi:hypothetical protein